MLLRIGQLRLKFDPREPFTPSQLRGAVAASWPEQSLLHQHLNGDQDKPMRRMGGENVVYMYPRIRYWVENGSIAVIGGIEEGVPVIEELAMRLKQVKLRLGRLEMKIVENDLIMVESNIGFPIGISKQNQLNLSYSFYSSWLALNEENYDRYQRAAAGERRDMLRRILIGNILSMSKGLGYVVTEEIKVSKLDVYPVKQPVLLKGVRMVGFKGTFAVNFELPDYIGLGKSVSRGFGTIRRVQELRS